jgi:hypothetical protein
MPEDKKANRKRIGDELKKLNTYIEEYRSDQSIGSYVEADGHSTIYIDLTKDPIYKEYSGGNLLNNNIYDFIEDTYAFAKPGIDLSVSFKFPATMSEQEKSKIKQLYHSHYAIKYKALKQDMRKERIIAWIFMFIGVVLLSLDIAFKVQEPDSVATEVLDIFAWVFIWQAGDMFVFSSLQNYRQANIYLRLFTAKLE